MAAKHFASGSSPLALPLTICRRPQRPPHALSLLCFPALRICPSQKLHFPRDSCEVAEAQPQMTTLSRASGLRAVGMVPRLWAVTLKLLRVLRARCTATAWQGAAEQCLQPRGGGRLLPASPQQAVCGSRRKKANAHPAAHRERERQAVPALWAEQKQRVTKARGKAQEMEKRSQH